MSEPEPRDRLAGREAWTGILVLFLLSAGAFACYTALYWNGLVSSDGINYAAIARNAAEGKGLVTPVILPGMIGITPTGREGQAFIIQQPLWPLLLSLAFRLSGASTSTLLVVSGLLYALCLVGTWLLGFRLTGRFSWAWVAWGMALLNPYLIGTSLLFLNVPLQAALLCAVFLVADGPPGVKRGAVVGLLVGLACSTRENSVFVLPAVAWIWLARPPAGPDGRASWRGAIGRAQLLRPAIALGVVVAVAAVPVLAESWRRFHVTGGRLNPTLNAVLLDHTKAGNLNWYMIYDHPSLHIEPLAYFRDHPDELLGKMVKQIRSGFLVETLPVLLAPQAPIFIPLLLPMLWPLRRPRALGYGLLVLLAVQVVVGSVALLKFPYFFAHLPLLSAAIAATAAGLFARVFAGPIPGGVGLPLGGPPTPATRGGPYWAKGLCALLGAYALAPLAVNALTLPPGWRLELGEFERTTSRLEPLVDFVREHTEADAVIAGAMHAFPLAWECRRTFVFDPRQPYRRIHEEVVAGRGGDRVPIDYVLLTSLDGETHAPSWELPGGFRFVGRMDKEGVEAWLYARPREGAPRKK